MRPSWLLIALIASLGLNLFLLGVGAAFLTQRQRAEPIAPPVSVLQAAAQLDPEDREAFRRVLRQEGRRIAPDLKAARKARREAARRMAEPAYDRAAVAAELERARAAEIRARTALETAVLDFAKGLDQDERAALARALKRGLDTDRRALRGERRGRRGEEAQPASSNLDRPPN